MKAVIVEIGSDYAVALSKNGEFIKVKKDRSFKVGYEAEVSSVKGFSMGRVSKIASMAAAFLLALGVGVGAYCYNQPYSYISVDINPSVELTSNIFNRIIRAEGMNEDGKRLVLKAGYKHRTFKEGIESIIESAVESGYLKDEKTSAVMLTVSSKSQSRLEKMENVIEAAVVKDLDEKSIEADVLVEAIPLEKHDSARKTGISPGRRLLLDRLRQIDPDADMEELEKVPVKEIIRQLKGEKRTGSGNGDKAGNQGNNGNNGNSSNKGSTVKPDTAVKKAGSGETGEKGLSGKEESKNGHAETKDSIPSNKGVNQGNGNNAGSKGNSGLSAGKTGGGSNKPRANNSEKGVGKSKADKKDKGITTDEDSLGNGNDGEGTEVTGDTGYYYEQGQEESEGTGDVYSGGKDKGRDKKWGNGNGKVKVK